MGEGSEQGEKPFQLTIGMMTCDFDHKEWFENLQALLKVLTL